MAPAVLKHLLTSFSPKGDYLAICAGDGRIKTWDTVTGSVKADFADLATSTTGIDATANGHLSVDYTCMAWNPAMKKGKKKHSSFLIGLGTGSGDVFLLDSALGQLKWKLCDCHPGGVKAVTFSNSGSIIYSTGVDGMVCEIEVDTGKLLQKFRASKRPITCLAISKDDRNLVIGSSDLRLFDLSTKKRLSKFTGHPDAVKALVYTEDGKHFLSSATGERHVSFWNSDGGKKSSSAVCSLSMEHPAISLDCSGDFSTKLHVVAVSEVGVAYVWNASNIEELSKLDPIKICINGNNGTPKNAVNIRSGILAAKFAGNNNVLVAFGTTVKPSFERLSLEGRDSDILLQINQDGAILSSDSVPVSEKKEPSEAKILGADNAVDIDNVRPHIEFEETPTKPSKKKKRASLEETPKIDIQQTKVPDVEADGQEETMEEKLKKLGILGDEEEENVEKKMATPKADSLQVLLTQALESEDKSLLEKCLIVTNEKVISKTMRYLAPSNVARFLQISVFQIDSRTRRSLILVPWIKAALLYHASYIISNPAMQPVLSSLYQVIEARVSVYRPLLSLSGRLDLISAQISASQIKTDEEVSGAVVYEESDEDNDEEEDDDDDSDEGEVEDVMDTDNIESASDESDEDLGNQNAPSKLNDSDGSADPMMEDDDDF